MCIPIEIGRVALSSAMALIGASVFISGPGAR
jgi:hypothetical protein